MSAPDSVCNVVVYRYNKIKARSRLDLSIYACGARIVFPSLLPLRWERPALIPPAPEAVPPPLAAPWSTPPIYVVAHHPSSPRFIPLQKEPRLSNTTEVRPATHSSHVTQSARKQRRPPAAVARRRRPAQDSPGHQGLRPLSQAQGPLRR